MNSNSVVGRWGANILVPEMVLGGVAYTVMAYHGFNINISLAFAFVVAAVIATIHSSIEAFNGRAVGVAVTVASLSFALAAFSVLSGAISLALTFFLLTIVLVKYANRLVKRE